MKHSHIINNNFLIFNIEEKFNIEDVNDFEIHFSNIVKENNQCNVIAFNMSNMAYIDSSALGAVIKFMNIIKSDGKEFFIYNLSENVLSILQKAYLDKFFYISTSEKLNDKFNTTAFQ